MIKKKMHLLIISLAIVITAGSQAADDVGFAKPGSSVAILDMFNLTENPEYDSWERLLGRGLRRSLHTYKTQNHIQLEVVPYPRIFGALKELGLDTYYVAPEQAKAIGDRLQSDLVVLGSFNVVDGVIATSIKIVDNHSGKLLHEGTRFGTEEKIRGFVGDVGDALNHLLLAGVQGQVTAPPPAAVVVTPPTQNESPVESPAAVETPLEPVEEVEGIVEEYGPPAMTQIAGPGGGIPPPSMDESPPPAEVVVVEPPQAAVPATANQPTGGVQQMLNQSWQKTQGVTVSAPTQQIAPPLVQQPYSPQPNTPPYVTAPPQVQTQPQQPIAMNQPSGLPPRAPVVPSEPIDSMIPPLAPQNQAPPAAINSPFQPMTIPAAPPPSPEQLGYQMTPPMPNAYPQGYPQQYAQPQNQRGPVGRFFNWMGRGIGVVEDPATQPMMQNPYPQGQVQQQPMVQPQQVPQQQVVPQEERRPFLWIFDRNN